MNIKYLRNLNLCIVVVLLFTWLPGQAAQSTPSKPASLIQYNQKAGTRSAFTTQTNNLAMSQGALAVAERSLAAETNEEPGGIDWRQLSTPTHPSARHWYSMAYDSERGVVVLFGGNNGVSDLDDTWEFNGTSWVQLSPTNHPLARYGHAMTYDTARGVVVLFGGASACCDYGDTWEWDGTNWVQRSPEDHPGNRWFHSMAYDSARGVVVFFGGWNTHRFGDTWEYDGINWVQRNPTNHPLEQYWSAMTFDSERSRIVLFGGECGPGCYSDWTWEWDGINWVQRSTVSHPLARFGHSMVYDNDRGISIVFGGYAGSGLVLDDTWEYNGIDWEQRSPISSPLARYWYFMAYDSIRQETVLFGGFDDQSNLDDTWIYGPPLLAPILYSIDNSGGDSDYTIAWSNIAQITSYTLEEDDNISFSSPTIRYLGTQNTFQVYGQEPGDWYYRVKASNSEGESYWSNVELTSVRPLTPTLYPVENSDGDGNYLVSWSHSTGVTNYRLEEDDNPEFTSPTLLYMGSYNEYDITSQHFGIWYYRVLASNTGGDSSWSNIELVTVNHVAPDVPELYPIINNSDGNGDYIVDWSSSAGTNVYSLEEDNNSTFTSSTVRYTGADSQYEIGGQECGIWYYRALAINDYGTSPWSNTESVSIVPNAPILLPIYNTDGDGNYIVDWNDVTGVTSYLLEEDDNVTFTSPDIRYNGTNSQYQVSAQPSGLWYYRVMAICPSGEGPWSNTESISIPPATPVLFPINNSDRNGDYLVDWSNVTGATSYQLEQADDPAFTSPIVRYTGTNSQFQVIGQEIGTWYYRVIAINAYGESNWSSIQAVIVGWINYLPLVRCNR